MGVCGERSELRDSCEPPRLDKDCFALEKSLPTPLLRRFFSVLVVEGESAVASPPAPSWSNELAVEMLLSVRARACGLSMCPSLLPLDPPNILCNKPPWPEELRRFSVPARLTDCRVVMSLIGSDVEKLERDDLTGEESSRAGRWRERDLLD